MSAAGAALDRRNNITLWQSRGGAKQPPGLPPRRVELSVLVTCFLRGLLNFAACTGSSDLPDTSRARRRALGAAGSRPKKNACWMQASMFSSFTRCVRCYAVASIRQPRNVPRNI